MNSIIQSIVDIAVLQSFVPLLVSFMVGICVRCFVEGADGGPYLLSKLLCWTVVSSLLCFPVMLILLGVVTYTGGDFVASIQQWGMIVPAILCSIVLYVLLWILLLKHMSGTLGFKPLPPISLMTTEVPFRGVVGVVGCASESRRLRLMRWIARYAPQLFRENKDTAQQKQDKPLVERRGATIGC